MSKATVIWQDTVGEPLSVGEKGLFEAHFSISVG
jgi:hypothetical protein